MRLVVLLLVLLAAAPCARAQEVPVGAGVWTMPPRTGALRLPPRALNWQTLATPDLTLYFPAGSGALAADAAAVVEDVLPRLEALVGARLPARLPLLVYPAPRAFAASAPLRLGRDAAALEGVAEPTRGRLVVAFSGDRRAFRQTLAHELVHALLRVRYGDAGLRALLPVQRRALLPRWMEEGLAEYAAAGYGPSHDHLVRAAVAGGALLDPDALGGPLVYAAGASFFHYLDREFGGETVAEVLDAALLVGDGSGALAQATGLPFDALVRRWRYAFDDAVLPEVAARERLDERARAASVGAPGTPLSGAAFSPSGDRLALVASDVRGDRLVVLDLVGQTPPQTLVEAGPGLPLDALHGGRALAWSPDGRRIALGAAAPTRDVVVFVDPGTHRITTLDAPGFDRLTALAWRPDGQALALAGLRHGQSDLALLPLDAPLQFLTHDPASDGSPVWSGPHTLVFASDRSDALARSGTTLPPRRAALQHDLYRLDLDDATLARLTATPDADERPVAVFPDSSLAFLSDANGLANLYRRTPAGDVSALTDLYVGLDDAALSSDGLRVAYLAPGPDGVSRLWVGRQPREAERPVPLAPTAFARGGQTSLAARLATDARRARGPFLRPPAPDTAAAPSDAPGLDAPQPDASVLGGPESDEAFASRPSPRAPQPYRLRFGLDALGVEARLDPLYGFSLLANVRASDVLGRHRLRAASNLLLDLRTSDYEAAYTYQPFRRRYTARVFHTARLVPEAPGGVARHRYRHYGGTAAVSWPFSPYDRLDAEATLAALVRSDVLAPGLAASSRLALVPRVAFVRDVALPLDADVPRRGSRFVLALTGTPRSLRGDTTAFFAATAEARLYAPLPARTSGALRLGGATSFGPTPARFFTAGQTQALTAAFDTAAAHPVRTLNDFALATPLAPLRGFPVAYRTGRHALVASAEARFPLAVVLVPSPRSLPLLVRLGAVAFVDAGVLWGDDGPLRLTAQGRLDDLLVSGGAGLRTDVLGLPLRLDVGWPFDGAAFGTPRAHVSIGYDF